MAEAHPPSYYTWWVNEDLRFMVVMRRYRARYYELACQCPRSRRRKDGTCKHERRVLAEVQPPFVGKVRVTPIFTNEESV